MSKFLDRLERVGRGAPAPMGFGAMAQREEEAPPLVCLGIVRDGKAPKPELLSRGRLDAVLFAGEAASAPDDEAKKALGELPWGLWVPALEPNAAKEQREAGCDFLVVGSEGIQLAALEDEGVGYFLAVPVDMEDRLLRSIEELPVDGVFLTGVSLEPPLTLKHLMSIGVVRSMFSKYLLVEVSAKVSTSELEKLRDVGVAAVVVDLKGLTAKALGELHERLMAVPRQRKARADRTAILPHVLSGRPVPVEQEEEEEEEEF